MILVVGATGLHGGMITQRLLDAQQDVSMLVSPQSAYAPFVDAGARPVCGDLNDPTSLATACDGVRAVITTANSAQRRGDAYFRFGNFTRANLTNVFSGGG